MLQGDPPPSHDPRPGLDVRDVIRRQLQRSEADGRRKTRILHVADDDALRDRLTILGLAD